MELLIKILKEYNIELTDKQISQYAEYMEQILEYNEHINLTSITDRDEFIKKHYVDSILGALNDEFQAGEMIIDVGTGAGFPGVPLAILFPEKEFVRLDSLNKRLKIVSEICHSAGINNVRVLHSRAEDAGKNKEYREQFDICISRAVADLSVLSELCLPLVREGGYFLSYKGPNYEEELAGAKKAIRTVGGKTSRIESIGSADTEFNHNIIFIEKIKNTPAQYPRKAGTPSKNPIK